MHLLLLTSLLVLAAPAHAPRLTLVISVDSMGTDVLLRNRAHFHSGLATLLNQSAFFPNAVYEQAENVTAAGHTTLATGAYPWRHGIVGNRILNRRSGRLEPVFADPTHPVLEAPLAVEDVSPDRLMAETLSDRLITATQGRAKSIALSVKARAAIAMAGRLGQAWWFDEQVGNFVTGTYYRKVVPPWMTAFNERRLPDSYFGKDWTLALSASEYIGEDDRPFESNWFGLGRTFPDPITGGKSAAGVESREALGATPMMNDILVELAKATIEGEQLGKRGAPDMLWVSFSAVDRAYHLYGPYSFEAQDMLVQLDRAIGRSSPGRGASGGGTLESHGGADGGPRRRRHSRRVGRHGASCDAGPPASAVGGLEQGAGAPLRSQAGARARGHQPLPQQWIDE